MLVAPEGADDGVGYAAYAYLQGGAVGDAFGDVVAYLDLGLGRGSGGHLHQGFVAAHGSRQLGDVDAGVAVAVGHVLVDLRYDAVGALHGARGQVGRDAEGDVTLLVRLGAVDQCHVDAACAVAEELRHLAQEAGGGDAVAVGDPLAHGVGDEEAVDQEGVLVLRLAVGGRALGYGEGRVECDVAQLRAAVGKCLAQHLRDGCRALYVDVVAALYQLHGLGRRHEFDVVTHFL